MINSDGSYVITLCEWSSLWERALRAIAAKGRSYRQSLARSYRQSLAAPTGSLLQRSGGADDAAINGNNDTRYIARRFRGKVDRSTCDVARLTDAF